MYVTCSIVWTFIFNFLQKLNFTQFSLLGWSDGGITAMILAAKYPELVTKLVIWGANSHVTKEETEMYDTIR